MTEEKSTLVPALIKVDPCGQQMDPLPKHLHEKRATQTSSFTPHQGLWSVTHLCFQSKISLDPGTLVDTHLCKHERGMCEQHHWRILFWKCGMCFANDFLCCLRMSAKVSLNEKLQKITTQVSWCVLLLCGVMSFSQNTRKITTYLKKIDHIYSYEH